MRCVQSVVFKALCSLW